MKRRILFVDDEPVLLDGLKRMLRGMRDQWEMTFAVSAEAALEIIKCKPVDVVVTDVRMPGMDGVQLLSQVRDLYPQTVRIILSGTNDKDLIFKSIGSAHQYLSKPCEGETLRATISRACTLRGLLDDKSLVSVVSGIESLPSLPALYEEVVEEANSPNGSLNRVGEIISRDVGMSAKILKIVNSSFFGLPQHVTTPVRAVNLLGLEIVKSLILSVKIFSQFGRSELPGYSIANLWNHSISTGILAKAIAKEVGIGKDLLDEAFTAGLLHDVGKLVVLDELPEKCGEINEMVNSAHCPLWEAEQAILGTTHAQIGAYLMGIWGLSESGVEAIAFHHCPAGCPNQGLSTLTAVYLANNIVHYNPALDRDLMTGLDREYLERLGIADRVEKFRSVCGDSIGCGDFNV